MSKTLFDFEIKASLLKGKFNIKPIILVMIIVINIASKQDLCNDSFKPPPRQNFTRYN